MEREPRRIADAVMADEAERYRLSESEHQAIFEQRIKPRLFADAKTTDAPVAVIFGGQPGAGKSASMQMALSELAARGGAVEIVGDDLRQFHPRYAQLMSADDRTAAMYTDRDSGRWVEKSIAEAKALRVNVLIEGTMRNPEVVAATMKDLRGAGYEVDARGLAVNARLSEQGILQRYELQKLDRDMGRMTTPQAHQAAYDGMPMTLDRIEREKLADRVSLYRRGGGQVYENELRDGDWAHTPSARAALEEERKRPLTLDERRDYHQGYEKLAALVTRPERNATADEVQRVEELRLRARRELAAEVFRREAPEKAVAQLPELASAYAYVRACEAKAQTDGLSGKQLGTVVDRVRENVASQIERGEPMQQVRLRESLASQRSRDAER